MGHLRYKWLAIRDDGSTEIIEAETIDEVVHEINDEQPRAIIKMEFYGVLSTTIRNQERL